jgi:hypothetical protein
MEGHFHTHNAHHKCEAEIERKWKALEMFIRGYVNNVRVHMVAL